MTYRKKLIEVSLPLEAINAESAREKSIRHGHPSTLHLWWARRPLAACRAVIWSSLVDDPSEYMPDEESANIERERLFAVLEELVKWENINNEKVLDAAKLEIARGVARDLGCDVPVGKEAISEFIATKAPPMLDPFAGGGSIPLEAQRLGLSTYASDLNPVSVLINKALIEIPPKFADMPPIHPLDDVSLKVSKKTSKNLTMQNELWQREWKGYSGLAEDILFYGQWLKKKAYERIGHLYPKIKDEHGQEHNIIAWIWARTVKCPNPACGCEMPLSGSFVLSTKQGKEAYIEPVIENSEIRYEVKHGKNAPQGTISPTGAKCICCGEPVDFAYIREEGKKHRLSNKLIAVVAEGKNERLYFSPDSFQENTAFCNELANIPDGDLPEQALGFRIQAYGMKMYRDLFTSRQQVALATLCDLVKETQQQVIIDGGSEEYSKAIAVYLSFAIDREADINSAHCSWINSLGAIAHTFGRQAISMSWDYAEANVFSNSSGSFNNMLNWVQKCVENLPSPSHPGHAIQHSAQTDIGLRNIMVSTDPPYYDNIGYADLSDYFYIWMRLALKEVYPDLFSTILVPKADELIASPFRFNGKMDAARIFFENGMLKTFEHVNTYVRENVPTTVYYAYKQSENDTDDETASTGWETMLSAIIKSGFAITGTWPIRTERQIRLRSIDSNALASSIVLVCRKRMVDAPICTRREFLFALKRELSLALHHLQLGNIPPVDLAQAAIGPGMAVFSRYKEVLEADGSHMTVRAALTLINQMLDEYLAGQEGEYDSDTRWALAWFEQYGHEQGLYGVAEILSKAKNTSVEGLSHTGFLEARAGKVRLLRRSELNDSWDPSKDKRLTAWEACQYLIRLLDSDGEKGSGALLGKLGAIGETARDLAYRLFTICERKGWAQEALAYNMLVVAWPRIKEQSSKGPRQESML